jgi:tetratricopeptide (TPR) repeat protein
LGRAYVALGNHAQAEEVLSVTAQEAPNLIEVWEPLAASLFMQSKFEQAVMAYDWIAFFRAESAQTLENKAAALGSLGRYEEALLSLNRAESLQPGRVKTSVNRAITLLKLGRLPQAREALSEARRRDPHDAQVRDLSKVIQ